MNESRMCKKPVLVSDDSVVPLKRISLSNGTFKEVWMQELLEKAPDILPSGHIDGVFAPLVCVAREVEVNSGYIDILYISAKGHLVIVETKLWRNPEAKRQVVSQIIDYAKDLKVWDYSKLDSMFRSRHGGKALFEEMVERNYQQSDDEAYFIDTVERGLKNARFLLMIVGDGIREDVEKMTAFINESVSMQFQFALCELEVYELNEGQRLVVPQLTTKTQVITKTLFEAVPNNVSPIVTTTTATESTLTPAKKRKYVDMDDWAINTPLKHVTATQMTDFINDFCALGYTYHVGTADLAIDLSTEATTGHLVCMMLFGNGKTAAFQPSAFYDFLVANNIPSTSVDMLLDRLKPYLAAGSKAPPYKRLNGYYYLSFETLIGKKAEILEIFEEFRSNF